MLNIARHLIVLVGLLFAFGSQAQQLNNPCPGGGVPSGGRCVSPAEANANRSGSNAGPVYSEVWEDRYGALVLDPETGDLYPVEDEKSKRRAISAARKNCGKKDCVLALNVRNACIASSWGGGVHYSRGGANMQSAEAMAVGACRENNSVCRLKYSGCSLPVRVK